MHDMCTEMLVTTRNIQNGETNRKISIGSSEVNEPTKRMSCHDCLGLTYDKVNLWVPVAHLRNDDNQQVYAFAIHQA